MFRPILATSLILLGASAGTAQLPSIIGMGADNAAGVLGYCVKNRLVDATSANAVLDKLHKKPGVKGSGAFKSGETGIIHAGKKDISLDSLNPLKFRTITRTGDLNQVLAGIDAAREAGFERIKLNSVIMKGRNDDEVKHLVDFAIAREIDISFIEEMPLGHVGRSRGEAFFSSDQVRDLIAQHHPMADSVESSGGPARYQRLLQYPQTRIGFISPHSHNFCSTCNRVRLTAEGRLLLCLGHENSIDLRELLRQHPDDDAPLLEAVQSGLQRKPARHEFSSEGEVQVVRFMNASGG